MTALEAWLQERQADVPPSLAERMHHYLSRHPSGPPHDRLAGAALDALQVALERPDERVAALDLLAADALVTAAFEAAADDSAAAVEQLTDVTTPAALAEFTEGGS